MLSTHMEFGFIIAFFLIKIIELVFPSAILESILPLITLLVLLGFFGGLLPDIDNLENIGFIHRKTLHFPIGYGLLTVLLVGLVYLISDFSVCIMGFTCIFAGAWLHSVMDILDGFYKVPEHGVYEHITRKWIPALNWIPFAHLWEWSLQSIGAVAFIAISPLLPEIFGLPGWIVAIVLYLIIWVLSTLWEFRKTVPKRLEMQKQFNV